MKHGIENHPTVAAQYVKFLVTSKGSDPLEAKITVLIEQLRKQVEDALKMARDAKSSASSANNGVDQLKKAMKKT